MSIKTENGIYDSEEAEPTNDELCLEVYEASGRFIYVPKMESSEPDCATLDVFDETWEHQENDPPEHDALGLCETPPFRFREELDARLSAVSFSHSTVEEDSMEDDEEGEETTMYKDSTMDVACSEEFCCDNYQNNNDAEDANDSDEETIATFLTATGQRLALYAVEDSDQVFAVAVYDESGEPPTNFQFLMKSDVERLIGEGAVRTVKKPIRMKDHLVANEAEAYRLPHDTEPSFKQEAQSFDNDVHDNVDGDDHGGAEYEYEQVRHDAEDAMTDSSMAERAEKSSIPILDNRDDLSLVLATTRHNVANTTSFSQSVLHYHDVLGKEEKEEEENEARRIQDSPEFGELVQQSTVNSLLMDGERSDDELTFADVEATLGNLHSRERRSAESSKCVDALSISRENNETTKTVNVDTSTTSNNGQARKECWDSAAKEPCPEMRKKTNIVRKSHVLSSLIRRGDDSAKRQREASMTTATTMTTSLLIGNNGRIKTDTDVETTTRTPEAITTNPKAKRPRKQQLTSVNRGDSEIIIQPATFPPSQGEETKRKRRTHRPRRRTGGRASVRYKMRSSVGKRLLGERRGRRSNAAEPRQRYEIIEIDVDEEDRPGAVETRRRSIVEITIDEGGKDKGSSDKENEVIMVGDSDDEVGPVASKSGETSAVVSFRCEYCPRTFRRKRAVDMHSRVCPESPDNAARLESERTATTKDSSVPKKQFACKICQEKFDVVVVLARHVRSMHSLRKRPNPSGDGRDEETAKTRASTVRTRQERGKSSEEGDKVKETMTVRDTATAAEPVTNTSTKTTAGPTTGRRRRRRKRRLRRRETRSSSASRPGWKGEKLHCSECAKWFSSAAALASHSLRHATKKSEKQIRRCETCDKSFNSRLLYIRHTRMHDRVETLQKKLHHTRQAATIKLAALRKRARPPKL